jgi:hypothetical protein
VATLRGGMCRLLAVLPLVVARVAGAAITGGLAVFVARTEGAEFSGRFFLFVSTISILSVLTRLGADPYLSTQIAPRAAEGPLVTTKYLVSTSAAVGMLTLGVGAILRAVELASPSFAARVLAGIPVYLVLLAVTGLNMVWIAGAYCRAVGRASLSIFLETGLFSLWLFGLLEVSRYTTITPTRQHVALAVSLLLPALLLPFVPVLLRARRRLTESGAVKHAVSGIVGFGAVTVTNGVVILIPLQVLGWFGLAHEAGIYNAALRLSMFVGAFGVVIKSVTVRHEVRRTSSTASRPHDVLQVAWMALPWMVVSCLIASQAGLLASIFGPEFAELRSIMLIMLIAQCVYVSGNLIETRAVLAGERAMLNITSASTMAVALALTPLLVHAFQLQGAVWSFAITIVTSRLQLVWLYVRAGRSSASAASLVVG